MANIRAAAGRGEEFAEEADTSNATQFRDFEETARRPDRGIPSGFECHDSGAAPIHPLDIDNKTLSRWRDAVQGQFVVERNICFSTPPCSVSRSSSW